MVLSHCFLLVRAGRRVATLLEWHDVLSEKPLHLVRRRQTQIGPIQPHEQNGGTSDAFSNHADGKIVEIGGEPDYGLLQGYSPISFAPKRDNFRFQVMQMQSDQATFESVDIEGLYPAGYLSQGTGLSVIGFHCGAYLIAGDILRRMGYFSW